MNNNDAVGSDPPTEERLRALLRRLLALVARRLAEELAEQAKNDDSADRDGLKRRDE
jgi:LPS O-antigen subunit length determinant protein (WzzB/FepE family)